MNTWILGLLAGLGTAGLWTFTALFFETASKRLGSLNVNFARLLVAAVLFLLLSLFRFGTIVDTSLTFSNWFWLSLSGLVGFVLGDLFLFEAFILIGSRLSMLVYASVPPITALIGFIFLHEKLAVFSILGMLVTVGGIVLATATKPRSPSNPETPGLGFMKSHSILIKGLFFAFTGSLGQALGLILGKYGSQGHDSFSSTQIRVIAGLVGFGIIITWKKGWKGVARTLGFHGPCELWKSRAFMAAGALLGPFLGVSLGLLATQLTTAGIASTLMALVPVFIILPSVLLFKEKVGIGEIVGAVIACAGTALMFL